MRSASSEVRVLISLTTSLSSPGGAPSMKEEHMSVVSLILDSQRQCQSGLKSRMLVTSRLEETHMRGGDNRS